MFPLLSPSSVLYSQHFWWLKTLHQKTLNMVFWALVIKVSNKHSSTYDWGVNIFLICLYLAKCTQFPYLAQNTLNNGFCRSFSKTAANIQFNCNVQLRQNTFWHPTIYSKVQHFNPLENFPNAVNDVHLCALLSHPQSYNCLVHMEEEIEHSNVIEIGTHAPLLYVTWKLWCGAAANFTVGKNMPCVNLPFWVNGVCMDLPVSIQNGCICLRESISSFEPSKLLTALYTV